MLQIPPASLVDTNVIYPAFREWTTISHSPENIMLSPAVVRVSMSSFPRRLSTLPLAILLAIASYGTHAAAQTELQDAPTSCNKFGDAFQSNNDSVAVQSYRMAVTRLLEIEDFRQLDCIADAARSNKTRFPGGEWQLHSFYSGTSEVFGHATEEDWNNRIAHLRQWLVASPNSITAAVALAQGYINFAWHARGEGYGDTVTESGWRLFGQRIEEAKKILHEASALPAKCPHWYLAMQSVARAEGWNLAKSTDLLNQATALAPDYYYFYRTHAEYMLPKWGGKEGDAANFAEQSSNRVGGAKGDMLYFRIGERLICPCGDDHEFRHLSWARLQKGYEAVEKEYGASISDLNVLAFMATKNNDSVVADAAFKRIGDNYDVERWGTEDYFNQMKTWASEEAPGEARNRKIEAEAETNALTPDGAAYQKAGEQALATIAQQCAKDAQDKSRFAFMFKIGADGVPNDGWVDGITDVSRCVAKSISNSKAKKQSLFPKPPHPDYWIRLAFDPGVLVATDH